MDGLPEGPFWRFSLRVYGRPEVRDACLALQDRLGVDVNLLLLALWLGTLGHRLGEPEAAAALAVARAWQGPVVAPLRRVRRQLKECADIPWPDALEALRRQLAEIELAMERIEQHLLEGAVGPILSGPPDAGIVPLNLARLDLAAVLAAPEIEALLGAGDATEAAVP